MERLVYSEGNPPPVSPGTICDPAEGRTVQSEAKQADMNWIIKKYETTGVLPLAEREGIFKDISEMPSYQEALNQVRRADEKFMTLPPDVRAVFGNDPAVLLDAWSKGEHADVFEKIGWLVPVPPVAPEAPMMVQARNDETGEFESGLESVDEVQKRRSRR